MKGGSCSMAVGLVALTVSVFAPLSSYNFVNYDDGAYVTENSQVLSGLSSESVAWAFSFESSEATSNWHPLTWLSLMTDVTIFGVNAQAFHLVNLSLHIINVLLLFGILLRLALGVQQSAFIAAIFAIHPLHVESVAWISERKDVLSTLFVLLTIFVWLQYVQRNQWRWYVLSACCFVLSLLSKQMYVTLPFLLILLDYWPLRRLQLRQLKNDFNADHKQNGVKRQIRILAVEKLPFLFVAVSFCFVAFVGQKHGGAVGSLTDFPFVDRCVNGIVSYAHYLWLSAWPTNLAVFYPYPNQPQWGMAIVSAILLSMITIGAVMWSGRHPYLIVGWLWYMGTLVPVIGIVQIGQQSMADRYMYFPLVGLLLAATGLARAWSKDVARRRKLIRISAILVIAVMAIMARRQTTHWKDSLTLFSHSAEVAESSLAYTKLGYERAQLGELDAASRFLHRALRIDPNYVSAHNSLGNACLAQGAPEKAIRHFLKAVELDPDFSESHYNLGIIFSRLQQFPEAVAHYQHALRIDPNNAQVHTNLGATYAMIQENAKAFAHLHRAIQIAPRLPEAHFTLAGLLVSDGREAEAVTHFLEGLKAQPDARKVHQELARIYDEQGKAELANTHREFANNDSDEIQNRR